MNRITVRNIRSVGYALEARTLEVEFHSGAIYQYSGVPETIHQGLIRAASKGTYFTTISRTGTVAGRWGREAMIIKAINVKHFRSILDEGLDCDNLTVLVGRNGTGKSSFLRALDVLRPEGGRYGGGLLCRGYEQGH
jgi:KTSC domain/AAA ATPase domain